MHLYRLLNLGTAEVLTNTHLIPCTAKVLTNNSFLVLKRCEQTTHFTKILWKHQLNHKSLKHFQFRSYEHTLKLNNVVLEDGTLWISPKKANTGKIWSRQIWQFWNILFLTPFNLFSIEHLCTHLVGTLQSTKHGLCIQ